MGFMSSIFFFFTCGSLNEEGPDITNKYKLGNNEIPLHFKRDRKIVLSLLFLGTIIPGPITFYK